MIKCEICNKEFKNLSNHLKYHEIKPKEYYDKYLKKENEDICIECRINKTTFNGIKNGYNNFCSHKCVNKNQKIKQKIKKIHLKKYGVIHPSQLKYFQKKKRETCLKKYNVEYPIQSKEIKEKYKKTCLKNYGVENPNQLEVIKEKKKETCLKNHGVESPMQSKKLREEIKKTMLKKYGVEYPLQSKEIKQKKKETCKKEFLLKLKKILQYMELELLDEEYQNEQFHHNWKCLKCNEIFKTCWNNIQQFYKCPTCFPRIAGTSVPEQQLRELIQQLYPQAIDGRYYYPVKGRLFHMDILIPNLMIAIEYDEPHWHQDKEYDNMRQKLIENEGWRFIRYRDYVPTIEELKNDISKLLKGEK